MASRTQTAEVLVVGLGAMGAATLLQLARRGLKPVGIDQYDPPHSLGSTHGETRITREAVGEGAAFVPLVKRSHALWRALENETGADLFTACGGLILAGSGHPSRLHEQPDFLGNTIALARTCAIEHTLLEAGEMQRRYPQLRLRGDETGYFEPGAGFLRPEACVAAQLARAQALGAVTHRNEKVVSISRQGTRVLVSTDRARYAAAVTIVCAGPWLPTLLPAAPLTLTVRRQVLHWFAAEVPAVYAPSTFPIFIWHWGGQPGDVFYGFPDLGTGVKVATEQIDNATTADAVARAVEAAEAEQLFQRHVAGRLEGLIAPALRSATCLYTNAPGANFAIDWLPDEQGHADTAGGGTIVVSACSGHGFKHSAAIGEAVAEMAVSGRKPPVLRPFAIAPPRDTAS